MKERERLKLCGRYSGFTTRSPDTSTTCSTEGRPLVDVGHLLDVVTSALLPWYRVCSPFLPILLSPFPLIIVRRKNHLPLTSFALFLK